MYNCEIFSVRKSKPDFEYASQNAEKLESFLSQKGISAQYFTEISQDPKRINAALVSSLSSADAPDFYLFLNTLNTSNSASFKENFYEFITSKEAELEQEEAYQNKNPKIKIFSLGNLGNGYKGYCFRIREKRFVVLPYASLTGKELIELTDLALEIAEQTFRDTAQEYPDGISTDAEVSHAAKKEGFFASFIPHKGDSKNVKVKKIVVLVAIVAFIGALTYVINFFIIEPARSNKITSELKEIAYQNTAETNAEGEKLPEQDWAALKEINSDIVGWVRIDDTRIDYPVLEHEGDSSSSQYYLYRNYKEESDTYGSVFVDYRSTESTHSKNVILHGHNIQTGAFFHDMMEYGGLDGDLDFYKEHPIVIFNTPDGDAKWKIISVMKTSTLYEHGEFFNYMQGEFTSDAEFMNFVYNCRIRSLFDIPVMTNENDQLLTLSTCSYEFTGFRTVIVARKVREGEDEKVDVQLASYNDDVLFPDVYYARYGGTRPDPLTFKTAYDKGKVDWYDGKGNLKGSETLTATAAANPTEPPTEKSGKRSSQPEEVTYFTVVFMNYDGTTMEAYSVRKGDPSPYPDYAPTMPEDDYFTYEFRGWDTGDVDMNNVQYSMNIAPVFEPVPKE